MTSSKESLRSLQSSLTSTGLIVGFWHLTYLVDLEGGHAEQFFNFLCLTVCVFLFQQGIRTPAQPHSWARVVLAQLISLICLEVLLLCTMSNTDLSPESVTAAVYGVLFRIVWECCVLLDSWRFSAALRNEQKSSLVSGSSLVPEDEESLSLPERSNPASEKEFRSEPDHHVPGEYRIPILSMWPWGQITWLLLGIGIIFQSSNDTFFLGQGPVADTFQILYGGFNLTGMLCGLWAIGHRIWLKRQGQKPRRFAWLRALNFRVLTVVGILMFINLLRPAIYIARLSTARAKNQKLIASAENLVDYQFGEGNFLVSTPVNWKVHPNSSPNDPGLRLWEPNTKLHLEANAVRRKDVPVSTLEEFARTTIPLILDESIVTKQSQPDLHVVHGHSAVSINFILSTNEGSFFCSFHFFEFPDHWGILQLYASPSQYEMNQDIMAMIMTSVRQRE